MKPSLRWMGPILVALAGGVWLCWSWGTWADPVVDFGREVYVPWQLSEGKVLYRDIVSYFNGPLTPYFHALLFKLFGVSLRVLVVFNLAVVAILAMLLYRLIARAAGHLAATASGVAFFTLFAFAQYLITGNYNYVCPYSYELTHGITLSAGAMACLDRWSRASQRAWLAVSGVLLGLVFLTKAEIFLAATLSMGAGLTAQLWIARSTWRRVAADTIAFATCACGVVFAVLLLLMIQLPLRDAIRGLLGAWRWVGDRSLLDLPYFKELAGTDDISQSLETIGLWTAGYVVVFGSAVLFGRFVRKPGSAIGVLIVVVIVGLSIWSGVNWNNFIRPMPLLIAAVGILFAVRIVWKGKDDVLALMLCVWALAMLAKMPLNAHIYHYGFALAMPATLVGVAMLVGWLPAALDRVGAGNAVRAAALGALVVAIYAHAQALNLFWSMKTHTVGAGGDAFRADPRGRVVNEAIAEIERLSPSDATLAVVPEGLIINYLARRVNPTGQLNFTPPAIIMYGEDEMLRAFETVPPDYILLTGMDTAEYGAHFFGVDYAERLGAWIRANYIEARVIGPRPFQERGFGMVLMHRRPSAQSE